jgi:hypothetical protein
VVEEVLLECDKGSCCRVTKFGKLRCMSRERYFKCDMLQRSNTSRGTICCNENCFICGVSWPWKFSNIVMYDVGRTFCMIQQITRDKNFERCNTPNFPKFSSRPVL